MEEARPTFEQGWQGQFDGAEMTPPPHVWVAIDGALANEEISTYKKKTQLYQWVAAACLFLLSFGGIYYNLSPKGESISEEQIVSSSEVPVDTPSQKVVPIEDKAKSSELMVSSVENVSKPIDESKKNQLIIFSEKESKESTVDPNYGVLSQQRLWLEENQIESLKSKDINIEFLASNEKIDQVYGVADLNAVIHDQDEYEKLWAGVNVSAGSFDPNFESTAQSITSDVASLSQGGRFLAVGNSVDVQTTASNPGNSVSGGLAVGSRVNKFLMVSGGLQYNSFTSQGQNVGVIEQSSGEFLTSNELESSADQLIEFVSANSATVLVEDINVTNEFQYVSVPLKAGVILLDKKFNIVLNTGLSSNFLINANLQADDYDQEKENSENYKNVYFNFLSSVEFGYNVNEKYLISLEPNYNQAISDFTSSNNINTGKPKNFGVAVGVKYNF